MRKEPGQINPRIAVIVNESGGSSSSSSSSGSGDLRTGERRDVVGERVARVVGGLQQQQQQQQYRHHHQQQPRQQQQPQHRLALAVTSVCSRTTPGNEIGHAVEGGGSSCTTLDSSTAESSGGAVSPCSAFPPLSPSPTPPSPVSSKNLSCVLSKLGRRVSELRSRMARNGLHRRWWQRRLKNRYSNPCDHILSSCSRRLQRINQQIDIITKKHEVLRYDKIAEKYLHWENHLREQMMIRRWGTRRNVELDRERRSDLAKLECLKKRREGLVRMISAKGV